MQLANGRIGQEFDVPAALLQFIERGNASLEQRIPVHRGRDALRASIEQANTERVLEVCDRLRHGGLSDAELRGGLGHAAALDDRGEHVQIRSFRRRPIWVSQSIFRFAIGPILKG